MKHQIMEQTGSGVLLSRFEGQVPRVGEDVLVGKWDSEDRLCAPTYWVVARVVWGVSPFGSSYATVYVKAAV